jgi:hypothetical protein
MDQAVDPRLGPAGAAGAGLRDELLLHPVPRRQRRDAGRYQRVVDGPVQAELVAHQVKAHGAVERDGVGLPEPPEERPPGPQRAALGAEVRADDVHPAVLPRQRLAVFGAPVLDAGVERLVVRRPAAVPALQEQGDARLGRPLVEDRPEAAGRAVGGEHLRRPDRQEVARLVAGDREFDVL